MAYPSPVSSAEYLEDGAAVITASRNGRVGGSNRIFDTVAGSWAGFLIFDAIAIDTASGNETYTIRLEVSNSPTFATGVVEINSLSVMAAGQQAVLFDNTVNGTVYRYVRIRFALAGTTPSLTLVSWLIAKDDLSDLSLAELVRVMTISVTRFSEASAALRIWANGTAAGGPNGDGKYPLTDGFGNSVLVACPARTAATALTKASFQAIPLSTTPLASPSDPVPQILGIENPGQPGEALVRFSIDLHASRKTSDLEEITTLIGDELIPAINASTGIEGKVALKELQRVTQGTINPYLPPYNCRFDAMFHRLGVVSTAGSRVVNCPAEAIYETAKVGQVIQLSNAGPGGQPLKSTITAVYDSKTVQMLATASNSYGSNDCLFGTDDTEGMQAALFDARGRTTYSYGKVVMLPYNPSLCGALIYYQRSALFGKGIRQGGFIRLDDGAKALDWYEYKDNEDNLAYVKTQPAPQLRAVNRHADFVAMGDFALNGARYCQSTGYGGISLYMEDGSVAMPQVDPYPFFSRMHLFGAGYTAFAHAGRHSGSVIGLELIDSGGMGYFSAGYDANIANVLTIGNEGPGLYISESGGANNNILNLKSSFNGTGSLAYFLNPDVAQANVVIGGIGNNITNMRAQESQGINLMIIGSGNQFGDCGLDDTGCVPYEHFPERQAIARDVRAAIVLYGNANFNRFNDVGYGGAVHPGENYATHGVYMAEVGGVKPQSNSGRIYTKDVDAYFSEDTAATPGAFGTNSVTGIHASNVLKIDEQNVAYYYP